MFAGHFLPEDKIVTLVTGAGWFTGSKNRKEVGKMLKRLKESGIIQDYNYGDWNMGSYRIKVKKM